MVGGLPFTVHDLSRWPIGAEGVEIIVGALCSQASSVKRI
jgi:hypothetical protein